MKQTLVTTTHSPRRRLGWPTKLAVILVLLVATAAHSQGAALVDPASRVYTGTRGQIVEGRVRINNPAPSTLRLRLYLSDWTFDPMGQFLFTDVGTQDRSASDWVSFGTTNLELGPNQSIELPYTVSVPAGAEPGTHWTVLFAEGEPTNPMPGQAAAAISVRVGHIIYVQVPQLESDGAVMGLFGTPPSAPGQPYTVIAHYANLGNSAQGVEGVFTVRNERGEVVIEAAIERAVALPGIDRAFQIDIVGPLPAGNYTALIVLNFGDPERDVAGAMDFTLEEPLLELGASGP